MKLRTKLLALFLVLVLTLCSCGNKGIISVDDIPEYKNSLFIEINGNIPYFEESDYTTKSYETYSKLDALGRCGVAMACIGVDIMPTEEREESLSSVTPTGWKQANYDGIYLYHRCHLIGFQLTGENANKLNLITGTGYFNVMGMLPFENQVADYIKDTENHVLYRVTPIYNGNNLVATGVLMEAYSVEDNGEGVTFCVFVYNVQPGVVINYATGESHLAGESDTSEKAPANGNDDNSQDDLETYFVLNTNSKLIHASNCANAAKISDKNREEYSGDLEDIIDDGYKKAGCCLGK